VSIEFIDSTLAQKDSLNYDQIFLKQGVLDSNYRFLANKLYEFCSSYPIDQTVYDIKPFKLDSIHTTLKTKKALVSKGYLKEADEMDSLKYVEALKTFQEHNGLKQDGVVGKYTCWALNESTYEKVLRTSLMLEKLRKMKEYPDKCIRINIPEYKLRYYVHDSLKRIHNIVVGKPENQTPELQSKVRNIVVYPYWNVPHSIASKEILPAVKNNRSYLTKNNYKIYRRDHEVSPYYVNWKKIKENSFPYKVVQQPGPENSLGILKFEFHNNYSVYVHDTPSKSLFKSDVRSFSHGCMRCENPIDLGKTLLDYDSIRRKRNDLTADSLDSLLGLEENYVIKLKDPVPIFVEYNTVYADREVMIFYLDIYKRDEEYLKIMRD
jgi:murein L,D-transpeptidase YcbB/YkuD